MKFKRIFFIVPILAVISLACTMPGISGITATGTPVPTNTQAPSQTPQSSPTPISLPTQIATDQITSSAYTQSGNEDITVIADNSFRVDTLDYIAGIIQNNTTDTIEWIKMSVLIYNKEGSLIATESVYPFLDKLTPDDTSPFLVYSDAWAEGATYDFLVEDYDISEEPPPTGLEILSHNSYSDEYSLYLVGEIQNNSDKLISYVKIAAALYAADGTLLNTNYTYAMINYIAPGAKSPFKIWFSDAWQDGDTYEIQVQGSYDEFASEQVIQVVDFGVKNEEGVCTVTGNVKNAGAAEITYATVIAAFYDSSNTLLEAEWSYTTADTFPAGSTAPFTITSYSCPEYDHLEVYAGN